MKSNNIIFQTNFTNFTQDILKEQFKLAQDDKILMAIWLGGAFKQPVRKQAFLFTKQGFVWKFPTVQESGAEDATERSRRDFDFLRKDGTDFKLAFAKTEGIENELHLKTGITEFNFLFPSDFPKQNIAELESIIRDYFTGYFDAEHYKEKAHKSKVLTSLFNIPDFFAALERKAENIFIKAKKTTSQSFEQKKSENETKDNNEKNTEQKTEKLHKISHDHEQKENRFIAFIRYTIDLIADLSFAAAVVILVKPQLLANTAFFKSFSIGDNIKFSILMNYTNQQISEADIQKRNLLFVTFYAIFIILKLIAIFSKKQSQKIISFLLIIILGVTSILIPNYFLIFTILAMLILLTLQFSIGFSINAIKAKSFLFIVFVAGLYMGIHIALNSELQELLVQKLSFPAKWW